MSEIITTIGGSGAYLTAHKRRLRATLFYGNVESVMKTFEAAAPRKVAYKTQHKINVFETPGSTHLTLFCEVLPEAYRAFYDDLLLRLSRFQLTTTMECRVVIFTPGPIRGVGYQEKW